MHLPHAAWALLPKDLQDLQLPRGRLSTRCRRGTQGTGPLTEGLKPKSLGIVPRGEGEVKGLRLRSALLDEDRPAVGGAGADGTAGLVDLVDLRAQPAADDGVAVGHAVDR